MDPTQPYTTDPRVVGEIRAMAEAAGFDADDPAFLGVQTVEEYQDAVVKAVKAKHAARLGIGNRSNEVRNVRRTLADAYASKRPSIAKGR